mmetsp:Transcript_4409/g.6078  ORF Transcript_4409/g.6078 Transcript_4409/m.6078 type:complete len:81 (+) Transcript_4409:452-694(+)
MNRMRYPQKTLTFQFRAIASKILRWRRKKEKTLQPIRECLKTEMKSPAVPFVLRVCCLETVSRLYRAHTDFTAAVSRNGC